MVEIHSQNSINESKVRASGFDSITSEQSRAVTFPALEAAEPAYQCKEQVTYQHCLFRRSDQLSWRKMVEEGSGSERQLGRATGA